MSLKKWEVLLPKKKKLRNHINTTQLISLTLSYTDGGGGGGGMDSTTFDLSFK